MTTNRHCLNCGSNTTYLARGKYPDWRKQPNGYLCRKCYHRTITNPYWNPINNARRLFFGGKQILLKDNPRIGKCFKCLKRIGQIQRTVIHHIRYHLEDPLKDTIELCQSCHRKEHARLRSLEQ